MIQKILVLAVIVLLIHQHECTSSTNIVNVYVTWNNRGTQTDFTVSSTLGNGVSTSNAWIGVGLVTSASTAMTAADVIVCMNSAGTLSVKHNYNSNYASNLMSSSTPQLGISSASIQVVGSNLTCSYTRDNSNSNSNYFNLNTNQSPYMIVAYGSVSNGYMQEHPDAARAASSARLSFAVAATTTTTAAPATTTTTTTTTKTTTAAPVTTTTRSTTTNGGVTTTTTKSSSAATSASSSSSSSSTSTQEASTGSSTSSTTTTRGYPGPFNFFDHFHDFYNRFCNFFGFNSQ